MTPINMFYLYLGLLIGVIYQGLISWHQINKIKKQIMGEKL